MVLLSLHPHPQTHNQAGLGLGDDSNSGKGSVMWDGSWGEAEAPSDRKTCHIRRWSGVQLKPGFKPEFCPCVTLGNLLNLSVGFPGGAVVGSLPADAGDTGSSPGLGGSHMPRSGWAREP